MLNNLTDKVCVPCKGGILPLTPNEARAFLKFTAGWKLQKKATRLRRIFKFDDFKSSLSFIQQVGKISEQEGHHPDFEFGWGYANILIYTHKINGLHENDFILAAKINLILA